MKRILLFVATNLAIMVTVSIVLTILGIGGYRLPGGGLDYSALMVFCLIWGMAGSFISLALSRFMAKQAMGVQLVDGRTGHEELDWLYATVRQLTERAGLPMPTLAVIPKDAHHPAAAKLFLDFLLSREGQALLARQHMAPLRRDVPPIDTAINPNTARAIRVGPALLANLDQLTRASFLREWRRALSG